MATAVVVVTGVGLAGAGVASAAGALGAWPGHGAADGAFASSLLDTQSVDLAITKTGPVTAQAGNPIAYAIVVRNEGAVPVPVADIVVSDPEADDIAAPASPPQALEPGASLTWTATRGPRPDACGAIVTNTASVALAPGSGYEEQDTGDNASKWTTTVLCPVGLSMTKGVSGGLTAAAPGTTVPYLITVTNSSKYPVPFSAITVSDPAADSGSLAPADVPSADSMLAPGATATWTAAVSVANDVSACGTNVVNTAVATLSVPEGTGLVSGGGITEVTAAAPPLPVTAGICGAGSAEATAALGRARPGTGSPRLRLGVHGPRNAREGSSFAFRIQVANRSADTLRAVVVHAMPPRMLKVRATGGGGSVSGTSIRWSIGAMAPGARRTVVAYLSPRAGTAGHTPCTLAIAAGTDAGTIRSSSCTMILARRRAVAVTG